MYWNQQVTDMLVINFEIGDTDIVGDIGCFVVCCFNPLEEIFAGSWDKSRLVWCAHHSITLSRTSLTVRKDTSMISLEVVIQELLSQTVVNILLVRIMLVVFIVAPEGIVKCEALLVNNLPSLRSRVRRVRFIWYEESCGLGNGVHLNQAFCSSFNLCQSALALINCSFHEHLTSREKSSNSHDHSYISSRRVHSSNWRDASLP